MLTRSMGIPPRGVEDHGTSSWQVDASAGLPEHVESVQDWTDETFHSMHF